MRTFSFKKIPTLIVSSFYLIHFHSLLTQNDIVHYLEDLHLQKPNSFLLNIQIMLRTTFIHSTLKTNIDPIKLSFSLPLPLSPSLSFSLSLHLFLYSTTLPLNAGDCLHLTVLIFLIKPNMIMNQEKHFLILSKGTFYLPNSEFIYINM